MKRRIDWERIVIVGGVVISTLCFVLAIVGSIATAVEDGDRRLEQCEQTCEALGTHARVATHEYGCVCDDGTVIRGRR